MNGFSYDTRYDQNGIPQQDNVGADGMMMLSQDDMSGMGAGMGSGQSLDDIVNQNAKVIRRQSMPQGFASTQSALDAASMSGMSVGDFTSGVNAGSMGHFNFTAGGGLDQNGMLTGSTTPSRSHHQRGFGSRASTGDLGLQTSFGGVSSGYANMVPHSASAYTSPAHPGSGIDMNSPFIDPSLGSQMDFSVDASMSNIGNDSMNMNMYNNQFGGSTMASPLQANTSQGTPTRGHDPSSGVNSGMSSQYSRRSDHSSVTQHGSRTQNSHRPDASSPLHREMSQSTSSNTPMSASRQHANTGFAPQPQNPAAGSAQDHGMNRHRSEFDGVNGPVPVNADKYNPNNQGFQWDQPEGGWPSTMVGRPHHTQSAFKNVYSSTGFDMLGVLVGETADLWPFALQADMVADASR